ncbi:MAG: hypothetical protein V2A56_11500 [bacterium]
MRHLPIHRFRSPVRTALAFFGAGLILAANVTIAADQGKALRKTASDDYWHNTSVGNIGLTITNFGVLGQGFNTPDQPSCMYKIRTTIAKEQIEHFSYAGIWIGGVKDGQVHVTTAVYDGVFAPDEGGWEFTSSAQRTIRDTPVFRHLAEIDRRFDLTHADDPIDPYITFGGAIDAPLVNGEWDFGTTSWDSVVTRSSIVDASPSNPYAAYATVYDPNAVSHQDLITAFTDTNLIVPGTGVAVKYHQPLGIHVYLEAYSWNDPFADAFTILNYTVTNIPTGMRIAGAGGETVNYGAGVVREFADGDTIWTGKAITDPYFGVWVDGSVGNMNYTNYYSSQGGPGGRWNWYDNMNAYSNSKRLAMQFDFDGDAGWAQSYLGVKVLGAEPVNAAALPNTWNAYFHQWTWGGSRFPDEYGMPQTEEDRYNVMRVGLDGNRLPTTSDYQQSWMLFLSTGPMPNLAPGERYKVAYAIVAGLWNGTGDDNAERRSNLYLNAEWAQIAYDGEDRNGNGILDPGEDKDGDGKITRYILPGAPPAPSLAIVPADRQVTLYWNNAPEFAVDPISNKIDFEGYRVYSSPKTTSEGVTGEWTLLADWDVNYDVDPTDDDNTHVGYDLGMASIHLDSLVASGELTVEQEDSIRSAIQSQFGFEPTYRWVNYGVKNGWPRELYYSVTAYDRGDPANNLQSLESNRTANRTFAYPGTRPVASNDQRISVYPNPYRGRAAWDGLNQDERLIWFRYLPQHCEVTIFNTAGERIDRFEHDAATYSAQDVARIGGSSSTGERSAFAGGEHAWDLLTEKGQEIATGLYIYVVKDTDSGDKKMGRFLVIK